MRKDAEGRKLEPVLNKGLGLGARCRAQAKISSVSSVPSVFLVF